MENGRKAWKENLTVPNILSVLRILLIIPFVFFFLSKNYIAAAAMVIISGLSDMFDGMIARKFNQITALGKILDPIADKLTLVAVIICIGIIVPKIIPLVVILVVKDLLMLLGGAYLIQKKITPPAANGTASFPPYYFTCPYRSLCCLKSLPAARATLQC